MYRADLTGAKMYAASIEVDGTTWEGANWWKADFDTGDYDCFDQEAREVTTNESLKLLYRDYGNDLPTDRNELHSSIREFVATSRRKARQEAAVSEIHSI